MAGGHHRVRQHRHRPDAEDRRQRRSPHGGRHGWHRPRFAWAGPRAASRRARDRERSRRLAGHARFRRHPAGLRRHPATAHRDNWAALRDTGIRMLDLTPASIGPFCVPVVNLDDHLDAPNLNMVTCGGQATVPIVAAVGKSGIVSYAEIVSSISAKSAGPGTRANIDEFIETTATAVRVVGGAQRGKAVMILNPADPPVLMRNTIYCLVDGDIDHDSIEEDILDMVGQVAAYVPGYRLKQDVQFEVYGHDDP